MNKKEQAQYRDLATKFGLVCKMATLLDAIHHMKSVTYDELRNDKRINKAVEMLLDVQAQLRALDQGLVLGMLVKNKSDLLKSLGVEKAW